MDNWVSPVFKNVILIGRDKLYVSRSSPQLLPFLCIGLYLTKTTTGTRHQAPWWKGIWSIHSISHASLLCHTGGNFYLTMCEALWQSENDRDIHSIIKWFGVESLVGMCAHVKMLFCIFYFSVTHWTCMLPAKFFHDRLSSCMLTDNICYVQTRLWLNYYSVHVHFHLTVLVGTSMCLSDVCLESLKKTVTVAGSTGETMLLIWLKGWPFCVLASLWALGNETRSAFWVGWCLCNCHKTNCKIWCSSNSYFSA